MRGPAVRQEPLVLGYAQLPEASDIFVCTTAKRKIADAGKVFM
jgi:hypothetical protein